MSNIFYFAFVLVYWCEMYYQFDLCIPNKQFNTDLFNLICSFSDIILDRQECFNILTIPPRDAHLVYHLGSTLCFNINIAMSEL